MIRFALIPVLLGLGTGAMAEGCATAGLRVKCINVGPSEDGVTTRSSISARFIQPEDGDQDGDQALRRIAAQRTKVPEPTFDAGDKLPMDVMILMNPVRYGLPRPRDGWTYFANGREIYRADLRTRVVLDYVNPHVSLRR